MKKQPVDPEHIDFTAPSKYSEAEINTFLDENLMFLFDPSRTNDIAEARRKVKGLLLSMPPKFQEIFIDTKAKFVLCTSKLLTELTGPYAGATNMGHELYFPADVTIDTLRHEVGHIIDGTALKDDPKIRSKPITDCGYYSGDRFSVCSAAWKKATTTEIKTAKTIGRTWLLAKKHGDVLYDGDESTIEYLKDCGGQGQDGESFAEITRKYLTLYAIYKGEEPAIDEIMSETYPKLWDLYKNEVMPDIDSASIEKIGAYKPRHSGTLAWGRKAIPSVMDRPEAWTAQTQKPSPSQETLTP